MIVLKPKKEYMIPRQEFFDNHFRDAPYKYLNLLKKFM